MRALIHIGQQQYAVNLAEPLDISMPLDADEAGVNAFHAPGFEIAPVMSGSFIGSVKAGGYLNFFNVKLNPHGNGTHTECVGHITQGFTINQCLKNFFFLAEVISVTPEKLDNGDEVILREQVEKAMQEKNPDAVIIRTLPNDATKLKKNYSGNNPPYPHHDLAALLVEKNVKHFLIDLPSADREEDGGELKFHKTFWQFPNNIRKDATITELIFVPDKIPDGMYLLNLQIASFEL